MVAGHGRGLVAAELAERAPDVTVVVQERRGGTGHAVRIVLEAVGQIHGTVLVTYADTPLLRGQHAGVADRGARGRRGGGHRADHRAARSGRVRADHPRR